MVSPRHESEHDGIREEVERRLNQQLGLKIGAVVVAPGEIDHLTEFHTSPKPKRFKDQRPKPS